MRALAPVQFLRYVESRRIHLPKVLSTHALQLHYDPIGLGGLQTRWQKPVEDERCWLKNKPVGRRPICSRWFPDFDDTMVAQVQVASDPADVYSTDAERVVITFNDAASKSSGTV